MGKFVLKKRCKYCAAVLDDKGECACDTFQAEKAATQRIEDMKAKEDTEADNE